MARHINSNASKKTNVSRRPRNLDTIRTTHGDRDAFLNGAEKQNLDAAEETRKLNPETRARLRSRGDKINIYVIRGTRQQRELLKHAADRENTSMQKLIWDHLIRELEEKYGADLPLNNL
jgi:mucin-2